MFIRRALAAALLVFFAHDLQAQTPAPAAPPPTPGPGGFVQPGQKFWSRSINLGGSFDSAPYEQGTLDTAIPGLTGKAAGLQGQQKAAQMGLSVMHATNLQAVDVEASWIYAVVDPYGKVKDLPKFSVDYDFRQRDGQRYFILTRYAWFKDEVRHIDYSHQALVGLGISAASTKRVQLTLTPVVGTLHEKKGVPKFDGRWLAGWGGMERMVLTPNPFVQIEQREGFVEAFNDSSFRVLESYVGVKSQVARHLSIMFTFSHSYDNALAQSVTTLPIPGIGPVSVQANNRTTVSTTAGVQITF